MTLISILLTLYIGDLSLLLYNPLLFVPLFMEQTNLGNHWVAHIYLSVALIVLVLLNFFENNLCY